MKNLRDNKGGKASSKTNDIGIQSDGALVTAIAADDNNNVESSQAESSSSNVRHKSAGHKSLVGDSNVRVTKQ